MENSPVRITSKNHNMKKIPTVIASLLILGLLNADAQKTKKLPPPPPPPTPSMVTTDLSIPNELITLKEFYKRNPTVASLRWSDLDKIRVILKNGNAEEFSVNDEAQMKMFSTKYGVVPMLPPPPPP